MLAMEDPACSGELKLLPPTRATSAEVLKNGPVVLFAKPSDSDAARTALVGEQAASRDSPGSPSEPGDESQGSTWVLRPAAPPLNDPEADLWHYSDAGGFIGIVSTHSLWATSLGSLNDSAEYKHGREILDRLVAEVLDSRFVHPIQKEYLKGIVEISDTTATRPGLYVLCASLAAHSLAQWRAYGGSHGHAITLDPKGKLAILSPERRENTTDTIPHGWRKVLYDAAEQEKLILEALSFVAFDAPIDGRKASASIEEDRSNALVLNEVLAHCKEPSFAEEQEVRVLVQAPTPTAVRFRHGATGVTPYLVLTGTSDVGVRPTPEAAALPIRGAVVGPFTDRAASAEGTVALLSSAGYEEVPVEISTSTLR